MSPFRAVLVVGVFVMNVAHAEDGLGRLFLTPEQRHELDILRDPNAVRPATGLANPLPEGSPMVLNGVVRRSHGADVVWVNGTRASAGPGQPVQLRRGPDKNNRVTLEDAEGATARLKPGQFWDPGTGRVADCYGCTTARKATDLVALPESPVEPAPATPSETPATTAAPPPATTPPTTQP